MAEARGPSFEEEPQTALLHIRDAQGVEWIAAAHLSPLRSVTGGLTRPIEPGEELTLTNIQVVIR